VQGVLLDIKISVIGLIVEGLSQKKYIMSDVNLENPDMKGLK